MDAIRGAPEVATLVVPDLYALADTAPQRAGHPARRQPALPGLRTAAGTPAAVTAAGVADRAAARPDRLVRPR